MELIEQLDQLAANATKKAMKFPADDKYLGIVMQQLANDAAQLTIENQLNHNKVVAFGMRE